MLLALSIIITYSCDSSDESEQRIEEVSFEDLANLETDSKFNNFIGELTVISNQIVDLTLVEELISKTENLTEQEKLMLVNALGFDTIENYNRKQVALWKMWTEIVNKFGILYKDRELIKPIFVKLITQKFDVLNGTSGVSKDQSICEDMHRDCFKGVFDYLREQTGADCTGESTIIMCFPPPQPSQGALDLTFWRLKRCNISYYCCIHQEGSGCELIY